MKVQDVIHAMERIAPTDLAASWDNVGLLVGERRKTVRRVMLCIDLTAAVLDEALAARAELVLAYHPPIFKPVSRITADATPVLWRAARAGLAVYSMHTALDAAPGGTNDVLADAIGIGPRRPLEQSRRTSCKLVTFAPPEDLPGVMDAAFAAGAGVIGQYDRCGFHSPGEGTFRGRAGARPAVGQAGRQETVREERLELLVRASRVADVCAAVRKAHRYEEPVIEVYPVDDYPAGCGLGRVGELAAPVSAAGLVARVKRALGVRSVLVAGLPRAGARGAARAPVRTVACCAGSCGGLFRAAVERGAQAYVTGEMRHHDALAAVAAGLTVVCVGHSNSERPALAALAKRLAGLPCRITLSKSDRDPLEAR
jgi:dinuclear metal center YbgI/SA1388 family protein